MTDIEERLRRIEELGEENAQIRAELEVREQEALCEPLLHRLDGKK